MKKDQTRPKYDSFPLSLERYAGDCNDELERSENARGGGCTMAVRWRCPDIRPFPGTNARRSFAPYDNRLRGHMQPDVRPYRSSMGQISEWEAFLRGLISGVCPGEQNKCLTFSGSGQGRAIDRLCMSVFPFELPIIKYEFNKRNFIVQ